MNERSWRKGIHLRGVEEERWRRQRAYERLAAGSVRAGDWDAIRRARRTPFRSDLDDPRYSAACRRHAELADALKVRK
jgi:hypothetical protein